jgi:hypothetical protein
MTLELCADCLAESGMKTSGLQASEYRVHGPFWQAEWDGDPEMKLIEQNSARHKVSTWASSAAGFAKRRSEGRNDRRCAG